MVVVVVMVWFGYVMLCLLGTVWFGYISFLYLITQKLGISP